MADDEVAFPTLDGAEIAALDALGARRQITPGEYLYRAGDATYDFFVVVSGKVDIVVDSDGQERLIAQHVPGRFLGELNLLTGLRVFVSARVVAAGEVIVVPVDRLRRVLATRPELSDKILAAFIARRAVLMTGAATSVRVIGSRFTPESGRIREYLARSAIPHEWLDVDRDAAVEGTLRELDVGPDELPIVIVSGTVLRRPTAGALAQYLGLTVDSLPGRCFDLVVVGGGPAGLAAAVYGASEGLETLGVEMTSVGGQAGASSRIENYLGFPLGVSGHELTTRALVQAEKFGAHMTAPCAAASLREQSGHLVVGLEDGTEVVGRAVIVATGARYRRLDTARLEDFESSSVYYAATETEARECGGSPVVVAGGGNSAGQAALFLANVSPVTIVIRGPDLAASMSRYLVDRIAADDRITVRTSTRITALEGDGRLAALRVAARDGEATLPASALFSFIGAEPNSGWLSTCAALDDHGFVLTDRSLSDEQLPDGWNALGRRPLPYETSRPGLFAVGDVRSGSTKRVATAVGEGSAAVRSVHEFLAFVD
jgi:thioredoxin reductase (NADPH)